MVGRYQDEREEVKGGCSPMTMGTAPLEVGDVRKMKPCGNETKIGMVVLDLVDECERKHVSV